MHSYSLACMLRVHLAPPWLDYSNFIWLRGQLWSSSLCSFLQPPVTSSLFGPNIPLSTLFSNTLTLCPALDVQNQVSCPYKTIGKNNFCTFGSRRIGIWVPVGARFSPLLVFQTGSLVQPASYPMGSEGYSHGIKWPCHEADHSPPTNAEVKNTWIYTSTSSYVFMA
jgi:hypothetical protein